MPEVTVLHSEEIDMVTYTISTGAKPIGGRFILVEWQVEGGEFTSLKFEADVDNRLWWLPFSYGPLPAKIFALVCMWMTQGG